MRAGGSAGPTGAEDTPAATVCPTGIPEAPVGDTSGVGLVLVTLVGAVLVGWALGGRLGRLEQLPYRGMPLLAGALAAYLLGALATLAGLPARLALTLGLAIAGVLAVLFSLRSRSVHGMGLVGAGLLVNAVVVLLNGGMPVSADAAARAGVDLSAVVADRRYVAVDDGTALRPLGGVIPVPLPLRPAVVSAGDLLVAAGLGQLVTTAMLRRPASRSALSRPLPVPADGPSNPGPAASQHGNVRLLAPRDAPGGKPRRPSRASPPGTPPGSSR